MKKFYSHLDGEELIKSCQIVDHGPFNILIGNLTISRDHDLNLKINANGKIQNSEQNKQFESRYNNNQKTGVYSLVEVPIVKFKTHYINGEIKGAIINKYTTQLCNDSTASLIEEAKVYEITYQSNFLENSKSGWLTEWLVNVDTRDYLLPCLSKWKIKTNHTIDISEQAIKKISEENGRALDHVELSISNYSYKILFGLISDKNIEKSQFHGFISYKTTNKESPPKELRKKIRHALSFAFGKPISSLGYSLYDDSGTILEGCVTDSHLPIHVKDSFSMVSMPPALLANKTNIRYPFQLDKNILSQFVNGFIENYEKYNLEYVMWRYWQARASSSDLAIERFFSILNSFVKQEALLPKTIWDKIKKEFIRISDEHEQCLDKDEQEKHAKSFKILKNKINSALNKKSINEDIISFLAKHNLKTEKKETNAIKSRNTISHGKLINDHIEAHSHSKILHLLCNRIILKIIGVDNYIDYLKKLSSPYPVYEAKTLSKPIGE